MTETKQQHSESIANAAASLLACYPPRKGQKIIQSIVNICRWEEPESVFCAVNSKVSSAETSWQVVACPSSLAVKVMREPHNFIASEYNRMENFYRCPLCNDYVTEGKCNDAFPKTRGITRQFETMANEAFKEYGELYYGKGCVSSVYTWNNSSICDEETSIGVSILIKNNFKNSHKSDSEFENCNEQRGVWQSAHVGIVDLTTGSYHFQSSFYLDILLTIEPEKFGSSTDVRFNGSVASRIFAFEHKSSNTHLDMTEWICAIGEQVQSTENSFRGRLYEIYFGNAHFVAHSIRATPKFPSQKETHIVNLHDDGNTIKPATCESERVTASVPLDFSIKMESGAHDANIQTKRSNKESPIPPATDAGTDGWIQVSDEDGNPYFYNESTGKTAWERPRNSTDVLAILQNLNLSSPPEKYIKRIRKYFQQYGISLTFETFLSLMDSDQILQQDDSSTITALEYLVPAYGDRRKIQLFITQSLKRDAS